MKVIRKISLIQKLVDKLRAEGETIGFVPTMGALHKGHIELIKKARKENDVVIVSIFVNPIQFGPKEDFKKYPRPIKQDLKICKENKVDIVFNPKEKEMYPQKTILTFVEVKKLQDILCGKYRPGHFRGVATVVTKLFNIVKPHRAYFGEKDYQQLKIIKQMVRDLNFDIKIIPVKTVREKDGLALSSRNLYLSPIERKYAPALYKSLLYCKELLLNKKYKSIKKCIFSAKKYLENLLQGTDYKIQYFEIYDEYLNKIPDDFDKIKNKSLRIFAAIFIGNVRLIDNLEVILDR